MSGPTPEQIAAKLHQHDMAAIMTDPNLLTGSVASLMSLCLKGLADVEGNNTVRLTHTGLAVRKILETGDDHA